MENNTPWTLLSCQRDVRWWPTISIFPASRASAPILQFNVTKGMVKGLRRQRSNPTHTCPLNFWVRELQWWPEAMLQWRCSCFHTSIISHCVDEIKKMLYSSWEQSIPQLQQKTWQGVGQSLWPSTPFVLLPRTKKPGILRASNQRCINHSTALHFWSSHFMMEFVTARILFSVLYRQREAYQFVHKEIQSQNLPNTILSMRWAPVTAPAPAHQQFKSE